MLNEIANLRGKKIFQTVSYLPHFASWVVVGGLIRDLQLRRGRPDGAQPRVPERADDHRDGLGRPQKPAVRVTSAPAFLPAIGVPADDPYRVRQLLTASRLSTCIASSPIATA